MWATGRLIGSVPWLLTFCNNVRASSCAQQKVRTFTIKQNKTKKQCSWRNLVRVCAQQLQQENSMLSNWIPNWASLIVLTQAKQMMFEPQSSPASPQFSQPQRKQTVSLYSAQIFLSVLTGIQSVKLDCPNHKKKKNCSQLARLILFHTI